MGKHALTLITLGLVVSGCAGSNSSLKKQNQKLASELAEMRADAREERVRLRDMEKRLAMEKADRSKIKSKASLAINKTQKERSHLPVEVREAKTLLSEEDFPQGYEDYQYMGTDDEGVEIVYVGEAASNKVIKIPPNRYMGQSDEDYGYDDEPARPSLRTPGRVASRSSDKGAASKGMPAAGSSLSVTSHVPTIDSQLRQARTPMPRARGMADPRAEYRRYFNALKAGNHAYALTGFRHFVERFPSHDYSDNAQYWIGETFYDQKKYKNALVEFRKVVDQHPQGNKVPDGLLKLGYCYKELGEKAKARQVWQQVTQLYPNSNSAKLAHAKLIEIEE